MPSPEEPYFNYEENVNAMLPGMVFEDTLIYWVSFASICSRGAVHSPLSRTSSPLHRHMEKAGIAVLDSLADMRLPCPKRSTFPDGTNTTILTYPAIVSCRLSFLPETPHRSLSTESAPRYHGVPNLYSHCSSPYVVLYGRFPSCAITQPTAPACPMLSPILP